MSIERKVEMCDWKRMVLTIVNPEGRLKICKYKCLGYDTKCESYVRNEKR